MPPFMRPGPKEFTEDIRLAHGRAENHGDARGIGELVEARVAERDPCRPKGVLTAAADARALDPREVIGGNKTLNFASKVTIQLARIEPLNRPNPRDSAQ